jgi:hypothetical protein
VIRFRFNKGAGMFAMLFVLLAALLAAGTMYLESFDFSMTVK